MDDEVRRRIAGMKISGLALDTNIIQRYRFAFTSGLLAQVSRLKQCGVTVLLPSVVEKEVEAHLCSEASDIAQRLSAAAKKVDQLGLLSMRKAGEKNLPSVASRIADEVESRARKSLSAWIKAAQVEVVDAADYVLIDDLMTLYFESDAPFENAGPKKHEFPDAIALLALEGWAEEYGAVVAISDDGGWANYATNSQNIVVTQDLAGVLAHLQGPTGENASRTLFASIANGDPLDLSPRLLEALNGHDSIDFVVDADSQFTVTDTEAHPTFTDVEFPETGDGSGGFELVSFDDGVAIVRIEATASVELECRLNFAHGGRKEWLAIGNSKVTEEEEVEIEALVTLGGQIPNNMTIEHIEVLPQTVHIRISDAEPDWMNARRVPDNDS
ncbi:DUF4935 domain-containing protein [Burkholderia gladioli]|uniref:PIN domain-containing protein n=1 Tax=Burkholderia gladioli TaxID=28095 RepID=UPI001C21218D|nr:PIN domain-containing protein [Burkholderia gladioli]MBU9219228.1 DUF4935 domain-containing protein [Burkholderia gladioli]MDN7728300.1 PIN domain-containing protein [Burkholderia gladioli]